MTAVVYVLIVAAALLSLAVAVLVGVLNVRARNDRLPGSIAKQHHPGNLRRTERLEQ